MVEVEKTRSIVDCLDCNASVKSLEFFESSNPKASRFCIRLCFRSDSNALSVEITTNNMISVALFSNFE